MSAGWPSQSQLRIAKASGSARAVNVVSLTSDMTSSKNKVRSWIECISSISDGYLTANWQSHLKSAKGAPLKEVEAAYMLRSVASLAFCPKN